MQPMHPIQQFCISVVREGTFREFKHDEPIGDVFDAFFDVPQWRAEMLNDLSCVAFTGRAFYDNIEKDYMFLFLVQPASRQFDLQEVKVGEHYLTDADIDYLLDDIYFAYAQMPLAPAKIDADTTDEEIEMILADCEDLVRTGGFDGYPNANCEQIFDDFFADGRFHALVGEDDALYVNYSGVAAYHGKPAEFVFQFAIAEDRNSFEVASLDVDGKPLSDYELDAVLIDILHAYRGTP